MFMIPGLALFYGGMGAKNVLATVMQSFFTMGLVVLWVLAACTRLLARQRLHRRPRLARLLRGRPGAQPRPVRHHPAIAYAVFQLFFAAITPALITGAFAERMKSSAFAVFTTLWLFLVYAPLAHWVWAPGGWLREFGALDSLAGGTVVHMNSGFAALAAAIIIGKRRGFLKEAMVPHNLTLTILGAGILWFGWFGFNAGSALAANGLAAQAFIATNTATGAACSAGASPTTCAGARPPPSARPRARSPAWSPSPRPPATSVPWASIAIGLAAGIVCAWAVGLKYKAGYDDALDVVGVHAVGGMLGALLIGVFANTAFNEAGADGLLAGGGLTLLGKQAVAVVATLAFSFIVSFALLKAVDLVMGLRVTEEDELAGLDITQHEEVGYAFSEGVGAAALIPAGSASPERASATVRVPQGDLG